MQRRIPWRQLQRDVPRRPIRFQLRGGVRVSTVDDGRLRSGDGPMPVPRQLPRRPLRNAVPQGPLRRRVPSRLPLRERRIVRFARRLLLPARMDRRAVRRSLSHRLVHPKVFNFSRLNEGGEKRIFQNVKSEHLLHYTCSRFTVIQLHLELHIKKKIKKRKHRQFRTWDLVFTDKPFLVCSFFVFSFNNLILS